MFDVCHELGTRQISELCMAASCVGVLLSVLTAPFVSADATAGSVCCTDLLCIDIYSSFAFGLVSTILYEFASTIVWICINYCMNLYRLLYGVLVFWWIACDAYSIEFYWNDWGFVYIPKQTKKWLELALRRVRREGRRQSGYSLPCVLA